MCCSFRDAHAGPLSSTDIQMLQNLSSCCIAGAGRLMKKGGKPARWSVANGHRIIFLHTRSFAVLAREIMRTQQLCERRLAPRVHEKTWSVPRAATPLAGNDIVGYPAVCPCPRTTRMSSAQSRNVVQQSTVPAKALQPTLRVNAQCQASEHGHRKEHLCKLRAFRPCV